MTIASDEQVRQRYEQLFHSSPIAMCELDWSAVRDRISEIIASGVTNLDAWLDERPDELVDQPASALRVRRWNAQLAHLVGE